MVSTDPARVGKRLLLVDGSALLYRSFYAFIRNPLKNAKGEPTSVPYGILQTLLPLLEARRPDYLALVFDTAAKTFRHKVYADYKGHRPPTPPDLIKQIPRARDVIRLLGIPILEQEGVEADDLIGSLAREAEADGATATIVTGDKDFFQLVSPRIQVLSPQARGSDLVAIDAAGVRERFGVGPDEMVDLLALMGDASDNVPGVPGVGEKTAAQLIQRFHSLEALYDSLDKIERPSLREKLKSNREQAELSRSLVTIRTDLPLDHHWWELTRQPIQLADLHRLMDELGFQSLKRRFATQLEARAEPEPPPATDLFPETIPKPARVEAEPRAPYGDYRVVRDAATLESLSRELMDTKGPVAFDTETTGLNPMRSELVGISVGLAPGRAFYLPLGHQAGPNLDPAAVRDALRPFFASPRAQRAAQNGKFDWHVLERFGIPVRDVTFDTMVAAYLVDPDQPKNLDALAATRLQWKKIPTESLIGTGRNQVTMAAISVEKVAEYCCEDADAVLRLVPILSREMEDIGVSALFRDVEMPLVGVLARMERTGMAIDVPALEAMSVDLGRQLARLEEEIQEAAGVPFNVNSTRQVAEVLFERLKLPKGKRTREGYSTDVEVLETLAALHPLPKLLLAHRQAQKLKASYVDSIPRLVNPDTGRVHATFHQTVASTGRLSASDPSLQNIPIRTEEGRAIRRAFVAAGPRGLLASFDYSQVELRLLAHLSHDPVLTEAFRAGEDVHATTASKLFGVAPGTVTSAQRAQAKIVNFGIIYGMGPVRLARELNLSRALATAFIEEYKRTLSGVAAYITELLETAHRVGYVETILKRRRPLPGLKAEGARRSEAERAAVNAPIQGSAADLVKVAMIRIDALLVERGLRTKMILQVHDELLFETDEDEVDVVAPILKEVMEQAIPLRVPLVIHQGRGRTWADAHA
ncbi:MAG: DNA polymerase I [Candidatus Eiseniibacteriota bacterium]